MASVIKNLVEYSGLSEDIPILDDPGSFKQFSLQFSINLPEGKPDIKSLIKVMSEVSIQNSRIIKTPEAISEEGQILTGKKLIIQGELIQKIEYGADIPSQDVCALYFNIPFSSSIVIPKNFKEGTPISVEAYVEDIFTEPVLNRTLFTNIILLIVAEPL